jgi:hypothetical protein
MTSRGQLPGQFRGVLGDSTLEWMSGAHDDDTHQPNPILRQSDVQLAQGWLRKRTINCDQDALMTYSEPSLGFGDMRDHIDHPDSVSE